MRFRLGKRRADREEQRPRVYPHVEEPVREAWRYGGVGVTADDGIAAFLDDPDGSDVAVDGDEPCAAGADQVVAEGGDGDGVDDAGADGASDGAGKVAMSDGADDAAAKIADAVGDVGAEETSASREDDACAIVGATAADPLPQPEGPLPPLASPRPLVAPLRAIALGAPRAPRGPKTTRARTASASAVHDACDAKPSADQQSSREGGSAKGGKGAKAKSKAKGKGKPKGEGKSKGKAAKPRKKPSGPSKTEASDRTSGRDAGRSAVARFSSMYESRDGRLCVFEDGCGHIVAVSAARLV